MKLCPTCNEEFDNDVDVCPKDGTILVERLEEEDSGAESADGSSDAAGRELGSPYASGTNGPESGSPGQIGSSGPKPPVQGQGMSTLGKATIVLLAILVIGAGLVFWKSRVGGHGVPDFSEMSQQEIEAFLRERNPMELKALADNPDQKKRLVENFKQLLSLASEAQKEGVADKPEIRQELDNMRIALLATAYDQKINGDKGPMPPFGFISEDQVKKFWGEDASSGPAKPEANANSNTAQANANTANSNTAAAPGAKKKPGTLVQALDYVGLGWLVGDAEARRHESEFQIFIDNKLALLRSRGQYAKDQQPSEEELKQARDAFARSRIYYEEAEKKLASIPSMPEKERKDWEEFEETYKVQLKLQEANFLVQTYVQDTLAKELQVSDEEVKKYIAEHPDVSNTEEKRKKAEEVLKKVKEGGDFAELAKEYSEDPGSKDNGGLYENVTKGQFAPEFEKAALALEPGQVADKLVKTDFGYHIIKLVKKGETKGPDGKPQMSYDVRHILISTMMKNPDNPLAREMTVEQFVKQKLEKEKQEKKLEEIERDNPVNIPEDFKVPQPSQEQLDQMRKQQQEQMQRLLQQSQQQSGSSEDKKAGDNKEQK